MTSLSDILTSSKNIATALNQLGQTFLETQGIKMYSDISIPTVVQTGQGRIAKLVVVEPGSAVGTVYDAAATNATTNKLFEIPTTAGIIDIFLPVNNGIVIIPGTGQTVAISYS